MACHESRPPAPSTLPKDRFCTNRTARKTPPDMPMNDASVAATPIGDVRNACIARKGSRAAGPLPSAISRKSPLRPAAKDDRGAGGGNPDDDDNEDSDDDAPERHASFAGPVDIAREGQAREDWRRRDHSFIIRIRSDRSPRSPRKKRPCRGGANAPPRMREAGAWCLSCVATSKPSSISSRRRRKTKSAPPLCNSSASSPATRTPSKTNEGVFERAVDEVSAAARRLLRSLQTASAPKNREEEAIKAKARAAARFA